MVVGMPGTEAKMEAQHVEGGVCLEVGIFSRMPLPVGWHSGHHGVLKNDLQLGDLLFGNRLVQNEEKLLLERAEVAFLSARGNLLDFALLASFQLDGIIGRREGSEEYIEF